MAFNFRKALAFTLAAAMVVTAAPAASINTEAAAKKPSITKSKTINADKTASIKVNTVKKGRFIKITSISKAANVTIKAKINGKNTKLKKNKYYKVTGKSVTLKVTGKDAVADYTSKIKVTVFDKKGKKYNAVKPKNLTASVKVKASEFSIKSVVSTTQMAGTGYKYIRATFSKAIDSLDASEVEISNKATGQIYSVEKVALATNGKSADITLVGDAQAAGTRFLWANTDYIFKVTKNGVTGQLEFSIPAVLAENVITNVDADKREITIAGGVYKDTKKLIKDFNEVLGRTVTIEFNKDQTITKFTVMDETVVYGSFKYVDTNTDGVADALRDVVTKKEYSTVTAANAAGSIYATAETNLDGDGRLLGGNEVAYAKVTLNGNGTVRYIVSITDFDDSVYVSSVKDTDLYNVKGTTQSLKDYTILKDGKTLEVSAIKEGDVVFYDSADTLALVYTNVVEGAMTVYTDKIEVGGKRYDIKGHLNADGNVKNLPADAKDLEDFDGKNVKLYLAVNEDMAEVVPTDKAIETTSAFAVITKTAKATLNGSKETLSFKADDGSGEKEYTVELDKLTRIVMASGVKMATGDTVGGNKIDSFAFLTGAVNTEFGTTTLKIQAKKSDGTAAVVAPVVNSGANELNAGKLIKIIKDANGVVTGFELGETYDDDTKNDNDFVLTNAVAAGNINTVGDQAGSFKKDGKSVTDGTRTALLSGDVPVLIYNAGDSKVKKIAYKDVDFTFAINAAAPVAGDDGLVRFDGNKVAVIVINEENAGIKSADTVDENGVIVSAVFSTGNDKKLKEITVAYGTQTKTYKEFSKDVKDTAFVDIDGNGAVNYKDWTAGSMITVTRVKDKDVIEATTGAAAAAVNTGLLFGSQNKGSYKINDTYKLVTDLDKNVVTTIVNAEDDGKGNITVTPITWSQFCDLKPAKVDSIDVRTYEGTTYVETIVAWTVSDDAIAPVSNENAIIANAASNLITKMTRITSSSTTSLTLSKSDSNGATITWDVVPSTLLTDYDESTGKLSITPSATREVIKATVSYTGGTSRDVYFLFNGEGATFSVYNASNVAQSLAFDPATAITVSSNGTIAVGGRIKLTYYDGDYDYLGVDDVAWSITTNNAASAVISGAGYVDAQGGTGDETVTITYTDAVVGDLTANKTVTFA